MISKVDSLNRFGNISQTQDQNGANTENGVDFSKILKNSIDDMNNVQIEGQNAMTDLATGEVKDLHQAAIAIDKAEISMKLMLEVRNKAINAYKEILRTQI